MKITQSTVPGGGILYDIRSRSGVEFRILAEPSGPRTVYVDDPKDPDRVILSLELETEEADQIAEILHSSPIVDRVAALERRLEEHLEHRQSGAPPGGEG